MCPGQGNSHCASVTDNALPGTESVPFRWFYVTDTAMPLVKVLSGSVCRAGVVVPAAPSVASATNDISERGVVVLWIVLNVTCSGGGHKRQNDYEYRSC